MSLNALPNSHYACQPHRLRHLCGQEQQRHPHDSGVLRLRRGASRRPRRLRPAAAALATAVAKATATAFAESSAMVTVKGSGSGCASGAASAAAASRAVASVVAEAFENATGGCGAALTHVRAEALAEVRWGAGAGGRGLRSIQGSLSRAASTQQACIWQLLALAAQDHV
mgnify:CR=1 FL=1